MIGIGVVYIEFDGEWPAGFARFRLEARNPKTDLDENAIHSLQEILQWRLRKIWAHY